MLWGSRFQSELNNLTIEFSSSLIYDKVLLPYEIKVDLAYVKALYKIGILKNNEAELLANSLNRIENEFNEGKWIIKNDDFEDIHSAIEHKLYDYAGETAGKIHSGRSRNDLVLTSLKLWLRNNFIENKNLLKELIITLCDKASKYTDTIIPGYTHLQRAQPISLGFFLSAYIEKFLRDLNSFKNIEAELYALPLGSAALAGSTIDIDRIFLMNELGFTSISENALDTVSERDFILDYLSILNKIAVHISRISEDFIIWNTKEFNLIKIDDSFLTGSSIMPQKKNPDMLELMRGKSARVFSNYNGLITTLKGLPLSYNRDLQEDKYYLFDSCNQIFYMLKILIDMLKTVKFNKKKFEEELKGDFSFATDLAEYLVKKNIPFRETHKIVGKLVNYCEQNGKKLNDLSIDEYKNFSSLFEQDVFDLLDLNKCLYNKKTYGSPNPKLLKSRLKNIMDQLNP